MSQNEISIKGAVRFGTFKCIDFYPRPVLAFGYCRCLCPSLCVSVRACGKLITHHSFKLGPPNLDQRSIIPWLRSLLFGGRLNFKCLIKLIYEILYICIAFTSLKYLWDLQTMDKTESVPHPKWVHTNMFTHSVVSWTMEQSSCIFSVTTAGFPVLDPAIGNGFSMLLQAFFKSYITRMPKFVCQHPVRVKTTPKQPLSCLISNVYWETRCYFSAHVNIRQTSSVVKPGFNQTVFALQRTWHS